jgi:hypothetical protein
MAEEFRIGIGGPLYRVEQASHLDKLGRLIPASVVITWVPLLVFSLAEWLIAHKSEPMLQDLSVHVRLLVTLPLLLVADQLLDSNCRWSVARLFEEGFVAPEQHERARSVLRSAERWRDSPAPESILLVLAFACGVASLVGLLPPAGFVHGVAETRYSAVRTWYALVSLPVFQFVLWRSLFHWALWVRVLGGLSRVPLRLLPTHADERGGIDFLKRPSVAYGAVLLLAVSSALCGGWETQILLYGTKIDALRPLFIAFLLIGTIIVFAPLLVFVPQLFRARLWGREAYGALVTDYSRQFQERWVERPGQAELLGNSDFQSLADLSSSYQDNVNKMRVILFELRDVVLLIVATLIPALPIVLTLLPAREVLKRLLHLLTGGMPS